MLDLKTKFKNLKVMTTFTILKSTKTKNDSFCHTLSYVTGPKGFTQDNISFLFTNEAVTATALEITNYVTNEKNCIIFTEDTKIKAL